MIGDFVDWCHSNTLLLYTSKTKEIVIDFSRNRPRPRPVLLGMELQRSYRPKNYLGLWLDNKLDWISNRRQMYKKAQSRKYLLMRLRVFTICRKLLWMFC